MPSLIGVHHIRLPVRDVESSSDWYRSTFGFDILLYEEEEVRAVGAVLRHPSGVLLGLHRMDATALAALRGFNVLGLTTNDLSAWAEELDRLGVGHSGVTQGTIGCFIEVEDPDGAIVQLHTGEQPDTEEA
jgi:catechol 2,3-dioxygenase-like lactoylglutathione lyase family enzyme